MRTIHTLLFALIIGIISRSSMAAEDNSGQDKGLLINMLELSFGKGSINSNTFNEKIRLVEERLKESCEKNNKTKAFHAAKKSWQSLLKCKEPEINEVQSLTPEEGFIMTFKKQCAIQPAMKDCMKQFKESVEPCLEPKEREGVEIINSFLNSALQFICEEDGARITKFTTDGGVNCTHHKKQAFLDCVHEFSSHYNSAGGSGGKLANGEMALLTVLSDTKNCKNVEKLQRCVVKVFNECEHHTPADIVDALFDSINKEIHCENYQSEASASSSINAILITVVMAIFLRFE